MVYIMGMQSDALGVKPTSLDELFESSTWKIKNIWDGVKLEIAPGDGCPVVLNSFTHLDPDLPVLELLLDRALGLGYLFKQSSPGCSMSMH
uniref:Ral guanine nucleotide dissociation stimulator n=1 Tax=Cyprinus carpio carpio TaxID=630221 RepID=A0A9J8D9Y4_CYPCA